MSGTRVIIFGATSLIGLHMEMLKPNGAHCLNFRKQKLLDGYHTYNLEDTSGIDNIISFYRPDVVINLASNSMCNMNLASGGRRVVLRSIESIIESCIKYKSHYIHANSSSVFGGGKAPYSNRSPTCPITNTGEAEAEIESLIESYEDLSWTIVRFGYILGIWNRITDFNILEILFSVNSEPMYVMDICRVSVTFADDAARALWQIIKDKPAKQYFNIGLPFSTSLFEIANKVAKIKGTFNNPGNWKFDKSTYQFNEWFSGTDAVFPFAAQQSPVDYFNNRLEDLYFQWSKNAK